MPRIYRCEQGSGEWYRLKMGKPSASNFHKIMTPATMKPSTQARSYMYRLIAERLLMESMEQQLHVEWIEAGKENEPNAVAQFEFMHGLELERVGFVTTDDGRIGCSPDRLVKDKSEAVEIKCPAPWTMIGYLLDGPGADYKPQVQGQLMVGEFERVHFYAYNTRMPALHIITEPDPAYMKTLGRLVSDFAEELDRMTERARSLGAYAASTSFQTPLEEAAPAAEPLTIIVP